MPDLSFTLTDDEAHGLAELIKRLGKREIGPHGLDLADHKRLAATEAAILKLRLELAAAGHPAR